MSMQCQWKDKVLSVTESGFSELALETFRYQYQHNEVYNQYVNALYGGSDGVTTLTQIPFLPIRFFKSHQVKTTSFETSLIFESSGTTGSVNSRHYIKDPGIYEAGFTKGFEMFYGPLTGWCIIGLLPSYLERKNSSLVYMVNQMIRLSGNPASGFYLNEFDALLDVLKTLRDANQKVLLIGVTFGLLDFAEACGGRFPAGLFDHTVIMETGGMKGRRREMIRPEVHSVLEGAFQVPTIHSEYGMTELLSQAYSKGEGVFNCPPWMKVIVRDEEDPLMVSEAMTGFRGTVRGALNIIDLLNVYSCSFIATDDLGVLHHDGSFEVMGRMDNSDLRGCSLMLASGI